MKIYPFIVLIILSIACNNSNISEQKHNDTLNPESSKDSLVKRENKSFGPGTITVVSTMFEKKPMNPMNIENAQYDGAGYFVKGLFSLADTMPWNSKGIFDIKNNKYFWGIGMHPVNENKYASLSIMIPDATTPYRFFNVKFMYTKHLKEQTDHKTKYLEPGTFRGLILLEGDIKPVKVLPIKNGLPEPNIGIHYYEIKIDISNFKGKRIILEVDPSVDISAPAPAKNWADHASWVDPYWSIN